MAKKTSKKATKKSGAKKSTAKKSTAKKSTAKKSEPKVSMDDIMQAITGIGKKVQGLEKKTENVNDILSELQEKQAILEGNLEDLVVEVDDFEEEIEAPTGARAKRSIAVEAEEEDEELEEDEEEEPEEDEEEDEELEEDEEEDEEEEARGPGRKPKTYKNVGELVEFMKEFPNKYTGSVPKNLRMAMADAAHALEECFEDYEGFEDALSESYDNIHNG